MKRIVVLGVICSCIAHAAIAQFPAIEFMAFRSWGSNIFSNDLSFGRDGPRDQLYNDYSAKPKEVPVGSNSLEVHIRTSEKVKIGAALGIRILDMVGSYWNHDPHSGSTEVSINERATTFSGLMRYDWRNSNTTFYSEVQLGMTHYLVTPKTSIPTTSFHEWLPAVQIIPFGLRVGGRVGIHLEAGFGMKGIFGAGLSWSTAKSHSKGTSPAE